MEKLAEKAEKVKRLLNGEVKTITFHVVGADWYRLNVDMYYKGTGAIEIVECDYDDELYAMPNYMTLDRFKKLTAEEIAEEWEI